MLSPTLIVVVLIPAWVTCQLTTNYRTEFSYALSSAPDNTKNNTENLNIHDADYEELEIVEHGETIRNSTSRPIIPICCKPGLYLWNSTCNENSSFPAADIVFPVIYDSTFSPSNMSLEEFAPRWGYPCGIDGAYTVDTGPPDYEDFYLLENGTIFVNYSRTQNRSRWITQDSYCFGSFMSENGTVTRIVACFDPIKSSEPKPILPMCCKPGLYLWNSTCHENDSLPVAEITIPQIYDSSFSPSKMTLKEFEIREGYPCRQGAYAVDAGPPDYEVYYLLENGSIFVNYSRTDDRSRFITPDSYCFGSFVYDNVSFTRIVACFIPVDERIIPIFYPIAMGLSLPFLVATFVVYTILPELKTMHGMTLRCYVPCLFFAYTGLMIVQIGDRAISETFSLCASLAFIIHFSFLASFFWLNVMCFDIWWTFGGFRSLQGSVKQRERKKFIIYSIYAWGCATLLTGVCLIMDFVPSVPRNFIRPEFGIGSCWFNTDAARAIYFYGPMGVTVICNICLFISTALKIIQHKKDTAHHLKGMDSRRHDDNKQWFNLYLKLFIVMGINWSMEIISWLCKDTPQYVWYITDLANTLQGLIIFIIFVWKDKIKRLLLKRLGCKDRSFQSRNSTRSAYHSSASRTCTTTAGLAPLQEKANPYVERTKTTTTDESDCV